jgi:hypothetical protein
MILTRGAGENRAGGDFVILGCSDNNMVHLGHPFSQRVSLEPKYRPGRISPFGTVDAPALIQNLVNDLRTSESVFLNRAVRSVAKVRKFFLEGRSAQYANLSTVADGGPPASTQPSRRNRLAGSHGPRQLARICVRRIRGRLKPAE